MPGVLMRWVSFGFFFSHLMFRGCYSLSFWLLSGGGKMRRGFSLGQAERSPRFSERLK